MFNSETDWEEAAFFQHVPREDDFPKQDFVSDIKCSSFFSESVTELLRRRLVDFEQAEFFMEHRFYSQK